MGSRRHFGTVRKRPSGRWQAVYWQDGGLHSAGTFASKADALARLSTVEADFRRGAWIDPSAGQVTLKTYANEWIARRPDLAVRTRELYEDLLRLHILPSLGQTIDCRSHAIKGSRVERGTRGEASQYCIQGVPTAVHNDAERRGRRPHSQDSVQGDRSRNRTRRRTPNRHNP